jgi:hypothetical protein
MSIRPLFYVFRLFISFSNFELKTTTKNISTNILNLFVILIRNNYKSCLMVTAFVNEHILLFSGIIE